jgi:hypothetical protein
MWFLTNYRGPVYGHAYILCCSDVHQYSVHKHDKALHLFTLSIYKRELEVVFYDGLVSPATNQQDHGLGISDYILQEVYGPLLLSLDPVHGQRIL